MKLKCKSKTKPVNQVTCIIVGDTLICTVGIYRYLHKIKAKVKP